MLMNVYLAKFYLNGKVAYKIGHTKWPNAIKRFDNEQYNVFDNVEILNNIIVRDKDPKVARTYAKLVEETLKAIFPKNFRLEEHFVTEENKFDGLSGITEMFLYEDEDELLEKFDKVKYNVTKVFK
jgi:hypothetical protein